MTMKKIIGFVLAVAVLLWGCASLAESNIETSFSQWNPEAPSLKALVEYVEAVTDAASPDYIRGCETGKQFTPVPFARAVGATCR